MFTYWLLRTLLFDIDQFDIKISSLNENVTSNGKGRSRSS